MDTRSLHTRATLNVGQYPRDVYRRISKVALPQNLPGPNTDFWDWQLRGACRGENSEVFYHPDGERGRARAERENRAKAICHTCPVISLCREHALESAEPYGVWGGMSEGERNKELRARALQRKHKPRKRAAVTV